MGYRRRRFTPKDPEGRRTHKRAIRSEVKLWIEDSDDSLKVARDNLAMGNYHVAAFSIHQAVEKVLKAAVIALRHRMPPKTHVLDELYDDVSAEVPLTEEQRDFLVELTPTHQVSRYVDAAGRLPRNAYTKRLVERYMENALPIIDAVKKRVLKEVVENLEGGVARAALTVDHELIERICDYVSRVDAELGVEEAFIFGSTAKGNRLKESDVDLIIVSKAFEEMPLPRRLYLLQKLWGHREELQALAYTPDEFKEASQRLMLKEILSYAIELVPEG